MSNQELAIRFTEENYASRADIAKVLGTSIVDTIWQSVTQYRQPFLRYLAIKNFDRNQLFVVLTPAMLEKINQTERSMMRAMIKIGRFHPLIGLSDSLAPLVVSSLEQVGVLKEEKLTGKEILKLLKKPLDWPVEARTHKTYLDALTLLSSKHFSQFNEDILAALYTQLVPQELVDLYRSSPLQNQANDTWLKVNSSLTLSDFESYMGSLFEYLKVAQLSPLVKIACFMYFTLALSPFEQENEWMMVLGTKGYLAQFAFDYVPLYLPFEKLLTDQKENFKRVLNEVQKTLDLTYLVNFLIQQMDTWLQHLQDFLTTLDGQTMLQERQSPSQVEQREIAFQMKTIKAELKTMIPNQDLAHEEVTLGLEEHQALQLEEHLLETNPAIKRLEAHFYARHCTIGKFYTIAQFKKKMSCAYETARTSMEHLTQLGYYRKEQFKNKFVYTPVSRK